MKIEIIKGICEVIVLVILYIIQWKQDERITVLEEKKKRGGIKPYQPKVTSFTGFSPLEVSGEPSFKSKLASEEKRMNHAVGTSLHNPIYPKKVTKKSKKLTTKK